jgi:hypothetical protein
MKFETSPSHDAAELGKWYALRGVDDWAVTLLEQARAGGTDISPLLLARCYWRLGRSSDAVREFSAAIGRNEAPAQYLELCLAALKPPPQPTTR